jgi:hypothetical protein
LFPARSGLRPPSHPGTQGRVCESIDVCVLYACSAHN